MLLKWNLKRKLSGEDVAKIIKEKGKKSYLLLEPDKYCVNRVSYLIQKQG